MSTPLDIIIGHSLSTLPDSLSKRRRLVEAIHYVITPKHPARPAVEGMIKAMDSIETAQQQLPLEYGGKPHD